jgi:hypothetical protein
VLVPYLLRLVPAEAAGGRIVGELESINSGRITTVHDVDELVALIRADQLDADSLTDRPEDLS